MQQPVFVLSVVVSTTATTSVIGSVVMSPRACLLGRTKCDCVCRVFCVFLYIRSYRAASNSLRRVSFVCRCVYRNAQAFNCGAPPLLFAVCAYLQLWVVGATLLSPPAHPAWEQGAAPCSRRRITQRSMIPCNLSVTMACLFFEPALIRRYS